MVSYRSASPATRDERTLPAHPDMGRQEKGPALRTTGRLRGPGSLAAIPLLFYLHRQPLHEFLGVRQIALCGREVKARSFHAVTGHDGVEDGFAFCGS